MGDRLGEESAWGNLGTVYLSLQEIQPATVCQQQALTIAQAIGHRAGEGRALGNLGAIFQTIGDTAQAIECYEALHAISLEIDDREAQQTAIRQLGLLYLSQENYQRAIEFQQQELMTVKAQGDWVAVGALLLNLATATQQLNHYAQAAARYEELLHLSQSILQQEEEKWVLQAMALYGLAMLHQTKENDDLAMDYCDRVLEMRHASIQPIAKRCEVLKRSLLNAIVQ